ncbi:MAG: hypothetical protein A2068_14310 [Ignavibacteria bacterium GWB2_35_6b]|nr:MAG: hypothetical protein A2068_14310 [Ignavibacteria bacterium GWB2_35_6b]
MKLIKTFILVAFFSITTFAQQASNLFQVITSDLTIQRDPVFRDLQTMLSEENAKELQGINLEILHTIVDKYKNVVLQYVQPLQIVEGNNNDFKLQFLNTSVELMKITTTQSLNQMLANLQQTTELKLETILQSASGKYISNQTVSDIVFYIIYTLISEQEIDKVDFNSKTNYLNLTANLVSTKIENYVKSAALNFVTEAQFDEPITALLTNESDSVNQKFITLSENLNNKIVGIFTNIHTIITKEVEKPLSQNLKGLTGFSASEGTGTFTGGALYSFSAANGKTRLSFYTNFNFNTAQDTVAHSLIGLRGAYSGEKIQLDILASLYFGNKSYDAFKVYEFGSSLNYNAGNSLVLGVAAFYTHNTSNTDLNVYSVGFSFKISEEAPAVILGFNSYQNSGEKNPIIQIHYPLNVNL